MFMQLLRHETKYDFFVARLSDSMQIFMSLVLHPSRVNTWLICCDVEHNYLPMFMNHFAPSRQISLMSFISSLARW